MFLAVAVWALIGCTGFVLAVAYGWLGPDAARGIEFCEQALDAFFRQPANTLSNLGFVFAGLAVAGDAPPPEPTPPEPPVAPPRP